MPASGPRSSAGRLASSRAATATANRSSERSVPATVKYPSAKSIPASAASSRCDAMRRPFSMISSEAWRAVRLARRSERPECEPAPIATRSGVAGDESHAVGPHAEPFVEQLRKARLVALAARQGADDHLVDTFRAHRNLGAFLRRRSVIRRTRQARCRAPRPRCPWSMARRMRPVMQESCPRHQGRAQARPEIAGLMVAEKRVVPLAGPFNRTAQPALPRRRARIPGRTSSECRNCRRDRGR